MSLSFIFVLVLFATILPHQQWRHMRRSCLITALIVFFSVGCSFIPNLLLTRLQSDFLDSADVQWKEKNVIVLLGGGIEKLPQKEYVEANLFSYPRIIKTGMLYHECKQAREYCKIIVSGGDPKKSGLSEAEVYISYLTKLGVQVSDILIESKSMNTWQNAQFTHHLLRENNLLEDDNSQIILVSSGIHLWRSMLYFSHFGIHGLPISADYLRAKKSLLPLAYNFAVMDFALHEYIGVIRYYIYNAFGWNVAKVHKEAGST